MSKKKVTQDTGHGNIERGMNEGASQSAEAKLTQNHKENKVNHKRQKVYNSHYHVADAR